MEDGEKYGRVRSKNIGMPLAGDGFAVIMLDIKNNFNFIRVVRVGKYHCTVSFGVGIAYISIQHR